MAKTIAYRGEYGPADPARVCNSRQKAIYFCTLAVAEQYAKYPNRRGDVVVESRVMQAKITMKNPFIFQHDSCWISLFDIEKLLGREEAFRIALKFENRITESDAWRELIEDCKGPEYKNFGVLPTYKEHLEALRTLNLRLCDDFPAYHFFDDDEEVEKLVALGYDGAMHLGNGESALTKEYCVFSEDQITPLQVVIK